MQQRLRLKHPVASPPVTVSGNKGQEGLYRESRFKLLHHEICPYFVLLPSDESQVPAPSSDTPPQPWSRAFLPLPCQSSHSISIQTKHSGLSAWLKWRCKQHYGKHGFCLARGRATSSRPLYPADPHGHELPATHRGYRQCKQPPSSPPGLGLLGTARFEPPRCHGGDGWLCAHRQIYYQAAGGTA